MQENNSLKLPQLSKYHWCWKNELHINKYLNFDHQMSLSKSKCWYSNYCLHFSKHVVPLVFQVPVSLEGPDPTRGPHQGDQPGDLGQLLQWPRARQLRPGLLQSFPAGKSRSSSGKDQTRHSGGNGAFTFAYAAMKMQVVVAWDICVYVYFVYVCIYMWKCM